MFWWNQGIVQRILGIQIMHSNLIGLLLYYSTDTRPRACTCMFKRVRYHKQTHKTSLELHLCIFGGVLLHQVLSNKLHNLAI